MRHMRSQIEPSIERRAFTSIRCKGTYACQFARIDGNTRAGQTHNSQLLHGLLWAPNDALHCGM